MKIRLLSVGRDRSGELGAVAEDYLQRVRYELPVEVIELPASRKSGADAGRAKEEEGRALLSRLRANDWVIALDERGELLSSVDFSRKIVQEAMNRGRDLAFLVGGAEGLDDAVRRRADRVLSLSPMTLPHRLARVVLAEQIYRALTIAKGGPYHK